MLNEAFLNMGVNYGVRNVLQADGCSLRVPSLVYHAYVKINKEGLNAQVLSFPGDLKTRKRTGTSYQIEIHFSIKTSKFLF